MADTVGLVTEVLQGMFDGLNGTFTVKFRCLFLAVTLFPVIRP
jgi:hypothetical protein